MTIHRNPSIEYNVKFGKIKLQSPYLWLKGCKCKVLVDEMGIEHEGRSHAVNRALSDFGIEESFEQAAMRFKEHYNYDIGSSAVARATKASASLAEIFIKERLDESVCADADQAEEFVESMLVEVDGCEIRTVLSEKIEDTCEKTAVYGNPKKRRVVNWRDVRIGFARPLDNDEKMFVGGMDPYPVVIGQLRKAALTRGMGPQTDVIAVADGGIGIKEELERQFPAIRFILDKPHVKDHLFETAKEMGIAREKRPGWVYAHLESISEGNVSGVLEELKQLYSENENGRLKRLIGYLERFRDAVAYNSFKEKGYPIGSGEIESAHKYIPQKRLKIAGASWHPDSINPMLALRILRADGYWNDFWEERTGGRLAA